MSEQSNIAKQIKKEIEDLNTWNVNWWTEGIANTEENKSRPGNSFTSDFKWVDFEGKISDYNAAVAAFTSGYGMLKGKKPSAEVTEFNYVKDLGQGRHMVIYREKFTFDGTEWQTKIVTAIFVEAKDAPNQLKWDFVHMSKTA